MKLKPGLKKELKNKPVAKPVSAMTAEDQCVLDMWTEKGNDGEKYNEVAAQDDFDRF